MRATDGSGGADRSGKLGGKALLAEPHLDMFGAGKSIVRRVPGRPRPCAKRAGR